MDVSGWFGVRCVFGFTGDAETIYEERVTLWRAAGVDEAIALAELDAAEYAGIVDGEYLGLAQAYTMADEPGAATEVFSLMRSSPLGPAEYLDAFFDTGTERQTRAGEA